MEMERWPILCTVEYNLGLSKGDRDDEPEVHDLTSEVTVMRGSTNQRIQ